jgi:hypothetical protein
MKKLSFLIVIFLIGLQTKAQDSPYLIESENFKARTFIGLSTTTPTSFEEFKGFTNFALFRVGVLTKTELIKNFSLQVEVGPDLMTKNVFTTVALNFKKGNVWFDLGKIASLITRYRPNPLTKESLLELYATTTLPGQPNLTLIGGWESDNFGLTVNLAERGIAFGDSTEYSIKATFGNFDLSLYSLGSKSGIISKYESKSFIQFLHFQPGLLASYSEYKFKNNFAIGLDLINNYENPKIKEHGDIVELYFIKKFEYKLSEKWEASGNFCLGVNNKKEINFYFLIGF